LYGDRHLVIMPNGVEKKRNYCQHTVLLHDAEELDNDLGGWSDENLSLSGLLCVVDGIERIVED
jgi:hypothetical protein